MSSFAHPKYPAAPRAGCDGAHVPVVIVGAGPVGLALAIDLAQRGVPTALLDDDDTVSAGSRAICWSQRSLQIFDQLGIGERVAARGVRWSAGRVFCDDAEVFAFELAATDDHRRPAFVNLQQYHVEQMLVERAGALAGCNLRWKHRCDSVVAQDDSIAIEVETPEGRYALACDWLVACDGSRSSVRASLALEQRGQAFRDRFLIADIRMRCAFPTQRWFWFDPPFNRGQSALLHRQADDVWRLDFQLGADADAEIERQPANVAARVRAMLGADAQFDIEWASVYTFACRRMQNFRHGRTLFAGDAAHVVSPFGARGANGGIEDAFNLGWKLARVIRGESPQSLLDSYDSERSAAADESIRHSTRASEFITPKTAVSRLYRDAVLDLARQYPFARQWVNSGRLASAAVLAGSALNTADTDFDDAGVTIGTVAADAPLDEGGWLAGHLGGRFVLLTFGASITPGDAACLFGERGCDVVRVDADVAGRRYDARPGTCYLVRPDQHVCARWRSFDRAAVEAAIDRASGIDERWQP